MMTISWYIIGLLLGTMFLTEGKDMWVYNQKFKASLMALFGAGMVARSAYMIVEILI